MNEPTGPVSLVELLGELGEWAARVESVDAMLAARELRAEDT